LVVNFVSVNIYFITSTKNVPMVLGLRNSSNNLDLRPVHTSA